MARSIKDIQAELKESFMADAQLQQVYSFAPGTKFDNQFRGVSLENLLLYIVAAAIYTHEVLFDTHTKDVEDYIANMKPHSLRWYVNKAKAFQHGCSLIEGTDQYDNSSLEQDEIEDLQVVKYAAATESQATVYLKVATDGSNGKEPLSAEDVAGLKEYMAEIKDAGVRIDIVNEQASVLHLNIDIHYNPMVMNGNGVNLQTGRHDVDDTIKAYIENLPFNGEYRNVALIDALQKVDGVVIPELTGAYQSYDGEIFTRIDAMAQPYSGYYAYDPENITINYLPYETVSD